MSKAHWIRGLVVVLAWVICAASAAPAPTKHAVRSTASVQANLDDTWMTLIDLFVEHGWAIQNSDKASGLITTDWIPVGDAPYADCGSPQLDPIDRTIFKFIVRVKPQGSGTSITVRTVLQRWRQADVTTVVECTSTGIAEPQLHREVATRLAAKHEGRPISVSVP